MADLASPNLPSRDFDSTAEFYASLGFECGYRDQGWMILHRGPRENRIVLEFFPYPDNRSLQQLVQRLPSIGRPIGDDGAGRCERRAGTQHRYAAFSCCE